MRPLKLTMQAFGPYAGRESINFSSLGNRTMFVISGKTGSGKTTIFDAISYAIYGKASGEDRTGTDLRSQFADNGVLTEVTLDFSLRNEVYRIIRTPQQERKKERGDGTRTIPATAVLYRVEGDGETKLLAGKINEVEERIKEIMLIDSNQFRQILMIPQGEFRKLLTSDSKDKELILQRLFHTQLYKLVEEKLKFEAQELKRNVEDKVGMRNEALKRIQAAFTPDLVSYLEAGSVNDVLLLPLLEDEIKEMDAAIDVLSSRQEAKRSEHDKLKQEYFKAEAILKQMKDRDEIEAKAAALEAQKGFFAEQENRIVLARKAALLASQEELCFRLKKDVDDAKAAVDGLGANIALLNELKVVRAKDFEAEMNREPERQEAANKATFLLNIKNDVYSFAAIQNNFAKIQSELAAHRKQFASFEGKLHQLEQKEKELSRRKAEIDQAKIAKVEHERLLERCDTRLKSFAKLEAIRKKASEAAARSAKAQKMFGDSTKRYEGMAAELESLEEKWLKGQASVLAGRLAVGDPCPVCGSEHHPQKAGGHGEDLPDEQTLRKMKQQLSEYAQEKLKTETAFLAAESESGRIAADLEAAVMEISEQIAEFKLESEQQFRAEAESEREQLSTKLSMLAKLAAEDAKVAGMADEAQKQRQTLQSGLEDCRTKVGDLSVKEAELKIQLERMSAAVPEQLRSVTTFEKELKDTEQLKERLAKQFETARLSLQETSEKLGAESARLQDAESYLVRKSAELSEERENFKSQMISQGFPQYGLYEAARLKESEISKFEQEVRSYNESVRLCTERLAELTGQLTGVEAPDLDAISAKLSAISAEITTMQTQATDLYLKKRQNEDVLDKVNGINEEVKQLEERYKTVGHLSDIARGQNTFRLTFERYVLAAFLDDILMEANIRLAKMTSGRFQLLRKTDRSKGNVQSGLELLVFDQYTAQERHVKTLSGGESFKAALALALGLADVVQAHAGGVSLETMFIDEGFGTLDPESLDQAIDALIEIQSSGRLVGIISHVPELKERIDARLEVVSTQAGSKAEFVIGI